MEFSKNIKAIGNKVGFCFIKIKFFFRFIKFIFIYFFIKLNIRILVYKAILWLEIIELIFFNFLMILFILLIKQFFILKKFKG